MRIGLALPHYGFSFPEQGTEPAAGPTVERVVEYAVRAERLGYDSVWISDHLFLDLTRYGGPPGRWRSPEALTLLSAIAHATHRVSLGPLVLCAPFRNPAVLAEQAKTLNEASDGRLELGIGAGWNEEEFVEAGIPFGSAGDRITALRAYAAEVRDRLGSAVPLLVGGKGGPRIMRIVAEAADGWNVVWQMTPQQYEDKLGVLKAACARAGRDPSEIRLSIGLSTILAPTESALEDRYRRLQRWAPGGALDAVSLDEWAQGRLVGSLERAADAVRAFAALGVREVILGPANTSFSIFDDEQVELGGELARLVR